MGTSSQWERFEFNKDAPVDDEEIEGKCILFDRPKFRDSM